MYRYYKMTYDQTYYSISTLRFNDIRDETSCEDTAPTTLYNIDKLLWPVNLSFFAVSRQYFRLHPVPAVSCRYYYIL